MVSQAGRARAAGPALRRACSPREGPSGEARVMAAPTEEDKMMMDDWT